MYAYIVSQIKKEERELTTYWSCKKTEKLVFSSGLDHL